MNWFEILRLYAESNLFSSFKNILTLLSKEDYFLNNIEERIYILQALIDLVLICEPVRSKIANNGRFINEDYCRSCQKLGDLICCETCPGVYHLECVNLKSVPEGEWMCKICIKNNIEGVSCSEGEEVFKIRSGPIGRDLSGRAYWFVCRRIIVESDNEIFYYSSIFQFEQLIKALKDAEETDLLFAINEMHDEIVKQLCITENLTYRYNKGKKSALKEYQETFMNNQNINGNYESMEIYNVENFNSSSLDVAVVNKAHSQSFKNSHILKKHQETTIYKDSETSHPFIDANINKSISNRPKIVVSIIGRKSIENLPKIQILKTTSSLNPKSENQVALVTPNHQKRITQKSIMGSVHIKQYTNSVLNNSSPSIAVPTNLAKSKVLFKNDDGLFRLGSENNSYENIFTTDPSAIERSLHIEEKERKRFLSYKFYLEFTWNGPTCGTLGMMMETVKLALLKLESAILPAFLHFNWHLEKRQWIDLVTNANDVYTLSTAISKLEICIRPALFCQTYREALGFVHMKMINNQDKDKDEHNKSNNIIKKKSEIEFDIAKFDFVKFTFPFSHQLWKQKGEEYRLTVSGGWIWISINRHANIVDKEQNIGQNVTKKGSAKPLYQLNKVINSSTYLDPESGLLVDKNGFVMEGQESKVSVIPNEDFSISDNLLNSEYYIQSGLLNNGILNLLLNYRLIQLQDELHQQNLILNFLANFALEISNKITEYNTNIHRFSAPLIYDATTGLIYCGDQLISGIDDVSQVTDEKVIVLDELNYEPIQINNLASDKQYKIDDDIFIKNNLENDNINYVKVESNIDNISEEKMVSKDLEPIVLPQIILDINTNLNTTENKTELVNDIQEPFIENQKLISKQCLEKYEDENKEFSITHGIEGDKELNFGECDEKYKEIDLIKCPEIDQHLNFKQYPIKDELFNLTQCSEAEQPVSQIPDSKSELFIDPDGLTASQIQEKLILDELSNLKITLDLSSDDPTICLSPNLYRILDKFLIEGKVDLNIHNINDIQICLNSFPLTSQKTILYKRKPLPKLTTAEEQVSEFIECGKLPKPFNFNSLSVPNIFALDKKPLRKLARRGGVWEVPGFVYNKPNVHWQFPAPRPILRTTFQFKTQMASSLSCVSLQLRILHACLRWDEMSARAHTGGLIMQMLENTISCSEVLTLRFVPPDGSRLEYLVRKTILQINIQKNNKRESYVRNRTGLRERKFLENCENDIIITENWVQEELLPLWQIRLQNERASKLKSKADNISDTNSIISPVDSKSDVKFIQINDLQLSVRYHREIDFNLNYLIQKMIIFGMAQTKDPEMQANLMSMKTEDDSSSMPAASNKTSKIKIERLTASSMTPKIFKLKVEKFGSADRIKQLEEEGLNGNKEIFIPAHLVKRVETMLARRTEYLRRDILLKKQIIERKIKINIQDEQLYKKSKQRMIQYKSLSRYNPFYSKKRSKLYEEDEDFVIKHGSKRKRYNSLTSSNNEEDDLLTQRKFVKRKSFTYKLNFKDNDDNIVEDKDIKLDYDNNPKHKKLKSDEEGDFLTNKTRESEKRPKPELTGININFDKKRTITNKKLDSKSSSNRKTDTKEFINKLLEISVKKIKKLEFDKKLGAKLPDNIEKCDKLESTIMNGTLRNITKRSSNSPDKIIKSSLKRKSNSPQKRDETLLSKNKSIIFKAETKKIHSNKREKETSQDGCHGKRGKENRYLFENNNEMVNGNDTDETLYCLCKTPYDNSRFYIGCDNCEDWFHGECVGVCEVDARILDTYICPNCQKSERKKLTEKQKSSKRLMEEYDLPHLKKLITSLQNHRSAWPFWVAVDKTEVPDYYDVIKNPIDLTTIESKLNSNKYSLLNDLESDILLMFENCRIYNKPDTQFCKCADILEAFFIEKFEQLKVKLKL